MCSYHINRHTHMDACTHKAPSLVCPCRPTYKNTGINAAKTVGEQINECWLQSTRHSAIYVEVTSALDGSVGSRVTCSDTGCCQDSSGPVEHGLLPLAAHYQPTTVCGLDCSHCTLHSTVSDVKQA